MTTGDRAWWEDLAGDGLSVEEDGTIVTEDGSTPDVHEDLVPYVERLRDEAQPRIDRSEVHHAVYEGSNLLRDEVTGAVRYIRSRGIPEQQLNFTKNTIDAIHVKVVKGRPGVKAVVSDADWTMFARSRQISRLVAAEFDSEAVYDKTNSMAREAEVDGTGVVHVYADWNASRVRAALVPATELFVDEFEARYGTPRQVHRVMRIDRDVLAAMFPEKAEEIAAAPPTRIVPGEEVRGQVPDRSMVDLYVSHRLPPSAGWEDDEDSGGRYVACTANATLCAEEYRRNRFPYVFFRWDEPSPGRGFWGRGIVEDVQRIQWEIDRLVNQIQYSLRVGTQTKVFVHKAAEVNLTHLAAPGIGNIIEHGGHMPQIVAPDPVSQQLFTYLHFLIEKLYQTSGMSQDGAGSTKPAGLNSGIALQYYHDFQTQRFLDQGRRWAQAHVDIAELWIDCAKELAEANGGYEVRWNSGDALRSIDWSQVDMDRDRFVLKLEAISEVPDTHSGRLNLITQLAQNGQIPESYVRSMFENPDVWRINRMLNAANGYAEWAVERLSDPDEDAPMPVPDPACDLRLTLDLVRSAYLDCLTHEPPAPPHVQDRFRDFMVALDAEMQKAGAAQAPAPTRQSPEQVLGGPSAGMLQGAGGLPT